jgi:hypothetical protein
MLGIGIQLDWVLTTLSFAKLLQRFDKCHPETGKTSRNI